MTPTRPLVIVTESLEPGARARLGASAHVVDVGPERAALLDALPSAEGLVVRTHTRVDAELLDAAPHLRVVGRAGTGLDTIDVNACRARGVAVVHTPEANVAAVVEFVFASILGALRPRPAVDGGLDLDAWRAERAAATATRQIAGSTVGILGFGRIGRRVAMVASALGAEVLFHDLQPIDPGVAANAGAAAVDHDALLARSDILTVHVDGRPENRELVDAAALARCRRDMLLVNASRGFVVDAVALAAFLDANPEALACIDVHDPEPLPATHPLLGHARAHLTAHLASRTAGAQAAMSAVVDDVLAVLDGRSPRFPAAVPTVSG